MSDQVSFWVAQKTMSLLDHYLISGCFTVVGIYSTVRHTQWCEWLAQYSWYSFDSACRVFQNRLCVVYVMMVDT
jgi:hypothetical protein